MESLKIIENKDIYIQKYFDYIDVSSNSVKEYNVGLRMFFEYCNNNNIYNIDRQDIINFREYLKEQGKSANTINLYLVAIKNFFKWLDYEGIYKDITKNIKALPVESTHVRQALNQEQVIDLLSYCQNDKEKLIILLAITTGVRCNEMCNIRLQDFKEKDGKTVLYILGKARQGMKTDFVIIPDNMLDIIKRYILQYNITDYFFISNSNNSKGKPLSTRSMRNIVNEIYERAGIKSENVVFHSLRHGFATMSIQNGVDIREVSQAMRHKEISTTMRYLHDKELIENNCSNTVAHIVIL